ncbi:MAG: EAL domain-containing protein [Pseudomonadota bacterium]|nr:MAG: EAL domain-containing protein [Pseudomonadota bacterium]
MLPEAPRTDRLDQTLSQVTPADLALMLLDVIPGIFYLVDEQARLRLWNARLEEVTGLSSDAIASMNALAFFDESEHAEVMAGLRQCLEAGHAVIEARLKTSDAQHRPHHFHGRRVSLNGQALVAGVALDVSRLKAVEADHALQREQLQHLARHVPGVVYQLKRCANGGGLSIPYASEKFHEVFGVEHASVTENVDALFERIHVDDQDRLNRAIDASAEGLTPLYEQFRMHPAGGRCGEGIEWVEIDSAPERLTDGSVLWHGFARLVSHRRRLEQKLTRLAYLDDLTGLPNRAHLQSSLKDEIERAWQDRHGLAVLYLDLDNFNDINDAWSHAAGDRLLRRVATRLVEHAGGDALVGRVGGDEFLVVLRAVNAGARAETLAGEIREVMAAPMRLEDRQVRMTISTGISVCPDDAQTAEDLIRHADAAVYKAKSLGPGHWARYTPELTEAARARRYLETELRTAIEREQIQLALQPIRTLADGRLVALEALARWHHWEDGWLSPDRFVAMAEKRGMIAALGELVYRRAMTRVATLDGPNLAINVAPAQLQDPSFGMRLISLAEACGLDPARLEVELTERAFVQHAAEPLRQIHQLREAGVSVTIDDFGTGFSSLGYLRRLPVQRLKIDRSFVRHVEDDPASAAIVRAVSTLARDLGMQVTAEGVETAAEAEFVREVGCDCAQGWFFGRPELVE